MKATPALELEQFVSRWGETAAPPDSDSLGTFAGKLAMVFGVKPDEVAILTLVDNEKALRFLIPVKLHAIGTIPLNSGSALAARTARERKADLVNTFAGSRHATVFEGVPLGKGQEEPIQKIMSAPIIVGGMVLGVVQISRKGKTQRGAGADFTSGDLRKLQNLTPVLARVILLSQKG
jgi:hypothetical protein